MRAGGEDDGVQLRECDTWGMAKLYDYHEYDASIGEIYVTNPAVPRLPRTTTVGSYQPNAWVV